MVLLGVQTTVLLRQWRPGSVRLSEPKFSQGPGHNVPSEPSFTAAIKELDNRLMRQNQLKVLCRIGFPSLDTEDDFQTFESIANKLVPRIQKFAQNARVTKPTPDKHSMIANVLNMSNTVVPRYLIAALLHNNAKCLSFWAREVTLLALKLAEISQSSEGLQSRISQSLAAPNVFISVFESGSTDGTGSLLDAVATVWQGLGIEHRVHTGGGSISKPRDRCAFFLISYSVVIDDKHQIVFNMANSPAFHVT